MLPAGLMAIATLTGISYVAKIRSEKFGTTSEISALLTFIVGALAMLVDIWIAMALGIVNTILLSEKGTMESYVDRLSKVEFLATIKFLLITLIIYPVLPNQDYTQFHINPAKIWQIVIIVSTLGFAGYLLEKKFGEKVGLWLSGLLGGIVSSTAVTVSVARMARMVCQSFVHSRVVVPDGSACPCRRNSFDSVPQGRHIGQSTCGIDGTSESI
jgi:uncharacterized membrane protein (DUF4010 family)